MVTCLPYTPMLKNEWDCFVSTCRTPLFFFQRDFIEYHGTRWCEASLLFYQENTLVAVLPACREGDNLSSHPGLTYGGLLLSMRVGAQAVLEIVQALLSYAKGAAYKKIVYKCIPSIFFSQSSQEDLYALFNLAQARLTRRDLSSVIYLEERLKLSKGRKWMLGKAKKACFCVENSQNWSLFYEQLRVTLARHHVSPVHSLSELQHLAQLFPDHIQLKIVREQEELLASLLLFNFKTTVHTQYIASSERGRKEGALDFLIEQSIQHSQQQGFRYFSFGRSTEEQGKLLNEGLIAQKESFGARGLSLDCYEIDL